MFQSGTMTAGYLSGSRFLIRTLPASNQDTGPQIRTVPSAAPRAAPRGPAPELKLPPGAPLRVVMNGDRLDIQASVDLAGLKKLKEMLTKFEGILEMMEPDKSAAPPEPSKYRVT
jgi:hypothetical protein